MNLLHHFGRGISQPDPIAAAHHAPRTLGPSLAHLGARFGAAPFFRARNRRPAKFFGSARHPSVLLSNPCARPHESAGATQDVGQVTQVLG